MKITITAEDIQSSFNKGNSYGVQESLMRTYTPKTLFFCPFGAIMTLPDDSMIKVLFPVALTDTIKSMDTKTAGIKTAEYEVTPTPVVKTV